MKCIKHSKNDQQSKNRQKNYVLPVYLSPSSDDDRRIRKFGDISNCKNYTAATIENATAKIENAAAKSKMPLPIILINYSRIFPRYVFDICRIYSLNDNSGLTLTTTCNTC